MVIFGLSELKISISKECILLMNDVNWSSLSLYRVKSGVRSCNIGTFLRNTSAGTYILRELITKQSKIKGEHE